MRNSRVIAVIAIVIVAAEAVRLIAHGAFSLSRYGGVLLERLPEVVVVALLIHFLSPDPRHLPDADEK